MTTDPKLKTNNMLLDARTANFLELIGNGKIYRAPAFQRDYSWKEEHWEDLWKDLLDLLPDRSQRHYMGALVIEAINDREFRIIDGQQRLATLAMLSLAVIHRLHGLADRGIDSAQNRERALALRQRFIGEKDPASLQESSKLFLNDTDDPFFQDYLIQLREPKNLRKRPQSNRLLWSAFQYFKERFVEHPDLEENGGALAALLNETVARQLVFILISVDDALNAYTIFETLNARGLELSATDLLKNYLFSRIHVRADLETLQRRWKRLIETVQHERFPTFLRHHLLCEHRQVREQRLFKIVRAIVHEPEQVFELMEALENRADLYVALSDPYDDFWLDRKACRLYIKELNLFGVRQMTPLLFAAWEKFDAPQFERVLKLTSIISFRHSVVGRLNTNDLEPVYHTAAKAVLDGRATTVGQVFTLLKPIYVSDASFTNEFSNLTLNTNGNHKKLVKYILAKLETDSSGRECDPETDPGTIEHILPENPGPEWEEYFPTEHMDEAVYRLGNLLLLEAGKNRVLGNQSPPEKLAEYKTSRYRLARNVAFMTNDEWNLALIDKRQRNMANRAAHLWRSGYV